MKILAENQSTKKWKMCCMEIIWRRVKGDEVSAGYGKKQRAEGP